MSRSSVICRSASGSAPVLLTVSENVTSRLPSSASVILPTVFSSVIAGSGDGGGGGKANDTVSLSLTTSPEVPPEARAVTRLEKGPSSSPGSNRTVNVSSADSPGARPSVPVSRFWSPRPSYAVLIPRASLVSCSTASSSPVPKMSRLSVSWTATSGSSPVLVAVRANGTAKLPSSKLVTSPAAFSTSIDGFGSGGGSDGRSNDAAPLS